MKKTSANQSKVHFQRFTFAVNFERVIKRGLLLINKLLSNNLIKLNKN